MNIGEHQEQEGRGYTRPENFPSHIYSPLKCTRVR
jgi:hypothetical protein